MDIQKIVREVIGDVLGGPIAYDTEMNFKETLLADDDFAEAVVERATELLTEMVGEIIYDINAGSYDDEIREEIGL